MFIPTNLTWAGDKDLFRRFVLVKADVVKEIINSFVSRLSHEEALSLALQKVVEGFNCNSCAIITTYEKNYPIIKTAKGLSNDYIKSFYAESGKEVISNVIRTRKAILITKGYPDFNKHGYRFEHDYKSLFAAPVFMHDKPLGIMYMDFTDDKVPSQEEQKAFIDIVNICSIIIDHEIKADEYMKTLNIDNLTGIYTYKYFNEELHKEIKRAIKFKHPLTVMIASIGHMNEYNSVYGYIAGNEAIESIADIVRANLHDINTVSRYAARFALIFPEVTSSVVQKFAEKILCDFSSSGLFKDKKPELTLRIGIASFPADAEDETSLLNIAEKNVYESTRKGGNSITVS